MSVKCLGLMGVVSGYDVTKTAICEITNTSGIYPIYGTITLTQTVGIIMLVASRNRFNNQ